MSATDNKSYDEVVDFMPDGSAAGLPKYVVSKESDDKEEDKSPNMLQQFCARHRFGLYLLRLLIINVAALTLFVFATKFWLEDKAERDWAWCDGYGLLLLLYCFTYGMIFYNHLTERFCRKPLRFMLRPCLQWFTRYKTRMKLLVAAVMTIVRAMRLRLFYATTIAASWLLINYEYLIASLIVAAIVVFLIIDTKNERGRLTGFLGVLLMVGIGWICSKHPTQLNFSTLIWGLIIQFLFGLISIRWPIGRSVFSCLSEKIAIFLNFVKDGARFIFSEDLADRDIFAFTVLPVLFFFSFVVQILYYWGVMQCMIKKVGWALHAVLGTTACESVHAATTLFLGMPESFLVIEPYFNKLTRSELHAIMCSCFATTSGTGLAIYSSFGAQPIHLITATVMSAPAGLCFAKLLYPETQKSSTHFNNIVLKKQEGTTFLDAATKGALSAIPLVLGIIANIIAFLSAVAFCNALISWLGALLGYPELTFELILAKVFIPLSYAIGVPWEECEKVGTLIGLKTIINELVAYKKLGQFKQDGELSVRAEAIATYAISGFSNPSAIGVMIGSLSTMAPDKKKDIISSVIRAFFGGAAVCFLTASIAGLLIDEKSFEAHSLLLENLQGV